MDSSLGLEAEGGDGLPLTALVTWQLSLCESPITDRTTEGIKKSIRSEELSVAFGSVDMQFPPVTTGCELHIPLGGMLRLLPCLLGLLPWGSWEPLRRNLMDSMSM